MERDTYYDHVTGHWHPPSLASLTVSRVTGDFRSRPIVSGASQSDWLLSRFRLNIARTFKELRYSCFRKIREQAMVEGRSDKKISAIYSTVE